MKRLIIALLALMPLFCTSSFAQLDWLKSKWNTTTNTTFSQLSNTRVKSNFFIYKGDALFTGTAWSNDGRFMKIICENGVISKAYIYHNNGKIASIGDAKNDNTIYYDENGKEITRREFKEQYKVIVAKSRAVQKEVKKKE